MRFLSRSPMSLDAHHAKRVEDPGELPAAALELLAHGPAASDVIIAKQELSMPTIGLEQIKGFSVWLIRIVMSGCGDQVIDLAKENLLPQ
jgi:pyruvate dehydrogenase (quinone)